MTHPHDAQHHPRREHEDEVVASCKRRQSGYDCGQEHCGEDDFASAEAIGQEAAEQVGEDVAVEVRAQQQPFLLLAPVEVVVEVLG